MEFQINYLAVVVAAVINMGLGFMWYGPLFGKSWMKMVGLSKEDVKNTSMVQPMIIGFASALVMAYVLNNFVRMDGGGTAMAGAMVGFWIWLGFLATSFVSVVIWERKSWNLYALNSGYYLVLLLINGAMLAVWR